MKYFYVLILVVSMQVLHAQEADEIRTLVDGKDLGGYIGFSMGYTAIDSYNAASFSTRGGLVIGHALALGIGGSGFVSEYIDDSYQIQKGNVIGGYGGVFAEFIVLGKSPVHLSFPVLIGFGEMAFATWETNGGTYEEVNRIEDRSSFLVIEPGVELEFNVTKYFRMASYFTYRYTSDVDIIPGGVSGEGAVALSPDVLNTYTAGIIFKFGKF